MTKDADKFICICYHDYLSRIKNGSSKTDAMFFSQDYRNENNFFSSWHGDDFLSVSRELSDLEFLKKFVDGSFSLTPNAIEYMENRFKNGLLEITDFISKLLP